MRGGWVAGVTRARLLVSRVIGVEHACAVAGCRSLDDGVGVLAGSAYGERVQVGMDLEAAERGVAETLLWHLRILAGWLPPGGAGLVRTLAAWFELANIDVRLAALVSDGREPPPFALGGLATAWPRIEQARSVEEVADVVAGSAWGDPGGRSPAELSLGLRVAWARRVQDAAPAARDWVAGAVALLLARELVLDGSHARAAQLQRLADVGEQALRAGSIHDLQTALPRGAWALQGITEPTDLWRAELRWWGRLERDAPALLRTWSDEDVVLASVTVLAIDAARAARALRAAAQGGGPELVEIVDGAL